MNQFITYKIISNREGKLRDSAKLACNFWNRYVIPNSPILIRLGIFTSFASTIARAFKPYSKNGVVYGRVEFNTRFLRRFSEFEIIGTIIHEIGHILGFGWDRWMDLFYLKTGKFKQEYIDQIPELANMRVETDYGLGTKFSHWDEEVFDKELMTGFKDYAEYVLPVTISVTSLLGHTVAKELHDKKLLTNIVNELKEIQFTRIDEAKKLERDYFEETDIWEEVYTKRKLQ
ncbi:MAG: hypothetical protein ACMUJM_02820 [bacterium]